MESGLLAICTFVSDEATPEPFSMLSVARCAIGAGVAREFGAAMGKSEGALGTGPGFTT